MKGTLHVIYSEVEDDEGELIATESWIICEGTPPLKDVILWGFGRQQDAEIVVQFLRTLDMDWSLPSEPFWIALAAIGYPDRDSLMKEACKQLQW